MSRSYSMMVYVSGHDRSREQAIAGAANREWPFGSWDFDGEQSTAYGEGALCGGETEEGFADRLAKAIWRANGAFCEISLDATCMENLPYETQCMDEEDYQRIMANDHEQEEREA